MIKALKVPVRRILIALFLLTILLYVFSVVTSNLEKRKVAALSWCLANKVIVVDPGHGGIDPGAKGGGGAVEKDVTLEVARQLATVLGQHGAVVIMTRETDTDLSTSQQGSLLTRKREDLSRRVDIANEQQADAFISIHVNSFKSGPRERGAQTFYQPGSAEGEKLASSIQSQLVRLLNNTKRQEKAVDYYTTRHAKVPAVIVEVGFISNAQEERLMASPDYQAKLAYAITAGIIKYLAQSAAVTGPLEQQKALETLMRNKGHVYDAP